MTKKKKLAKMALSSPENYSSGELAFFKLWLEEKKHLKNLKKRLRKDENRVHTPNEGL